MIPLLTQLPMYVPAFMDLSAYILLFVSGFKSWYRTTMLPTLPQLAICIHTVTLTQCDL